MIKQETNYYFLLCPVLMALIILSPALNIGYYSDDASHSTLLGTLQLQHTTLSGFMYQYIKGWIATSGRIFPLGAIIFALFYYIQKVIIYKALIIAMVVLDLVVFYYFVKILTKSVRVACLSLLIVPFFFQLRVYHDPIMAFHLLYQLILAYTFGSLIFLIWYLERKKKSLLWLSWAAYCCAVLTYEISYPLCLLHVAIIMWNRRNLILSRRLLVSLGFVVIPVLVIIPQLLVRHVLHSNGVYEGIQPSFAFGPIIITTLKQAMGAFPLSYFIFAGRGMELNGGEGMVLALLLIVGCFIMFKALVINHGPANQNTPAITAEDKSATAMLVLIIGIILWLCPAAMISLSFKYQREVMWGVPYLPVYISYFGVALLLAGAIHLVLTRAGKVLTLIIFLFLSTLFSLIGVITYFSNAKVERAINQVWLHPRNTEEQAIRHGLLSLKATEGEYLLTGTKYPWDNQAFYLMNSGHLFNKINSIDKISENDFPGDIKKDGANTLSTHVTYDASQSKIDYLTYNQIAVDQGYAIFGHIEKMQVMPDLAEPGFLKLYSALLSRVKVFVSLPADLSTGSTISFSGLLCDKKNIKAPALFNLTENELTVLGSGPTWRLYQVDLGDNYVDLSSMKISFGPINQPAARKFIFLKSPAESKLNMTKDDLFYLGVKTNGTESRPSIIPTAPITLPEKFTIELLVTPLATQKSYACILSNHPGTKAFQGFAIQAMDTKADTYLFSWGDGKEWVPPVTFNLTCNRQNYVVITFENGLVEVFVDGRKVAGASTNQTLAQSDMRLTVGDWEFMTRPFNGFIEEVRITGGIISSEQILNKFIIISSSYTKESK
ncbi:MAG: hypothetical protein HQK60_03435 [Deltaproteobacteria bacterium]|nr:hypothetical protein [Deltaproteobacteria bacterium]